MIHWSGRRDSKNEKTGRHIETSPPAGYDMQIKVEYSLRNIIMMFVTADDSASAEKKRGATGLVSNGAEEGLKEMVTLMEAGIWGGKVCVGRQQIAIIQLLVIIHMH